MNYLGGLSVPGFAGGMFPIDQRKPFDVLGSVQGSAADPQMNTMQPMQVPDQMAGINEALQRNQQMGQQRKGGPFRQGGAVGNILGMIGDALLVNSGHAPIYAPRMQQKQEEERRHRLGTMLGNYLGNTDAALAELFAEDPDTALAIYKMKNAQPEVPGIIREAQAYNNLPPEQRQQAQEYMRLRFPGMSAPITMGANDTIEMPGAPEQGGDIPAVSSPEEARQLPPGTQFRMPDGRIGTVPGGPTQPASVPFP